MQSETERQSIRLFENDLLESLTHVHPVVPLVLWSPIAAYLLWQGIFVDQLASGGLFVVAISALVAWTLTEYSLHRFAFHFPARSKAGQWFVFLFHGNHHHDPKDKTRLVMPPGGSVPILAGLYYLFSLMIPEPWLHPFTAFFIIGYLIYDYIHYATHHFPMKNKVAKFLKLYHLKHHYSGEKGRFGVSSPLWDLIFSTSGNGR